MNKPQFDIRLCGALLSIAVVFFLYSYFTPLAFDDLMFKFRYLDHSRGSHSFSWSAISAYAEEIRNFDNGRLSNILCAPVVLMLPHWLFSLVTGLCFALLYWLMLYVADIPRRAWSVGAVFVWAASLILLPFRNHIILCDYLLNYLYSSIFILWFVIILSKTAHKNISPIRFIGALLIAVIAAWFHEGFSAPVCIAFACYTVRRNFRLPWQWWLLCIVFGLVALQTSFAPGVMARANREFLGHSLFEIAKIIIFVLPAVLLMIGVFVAALFNSRIRAITKKILDNPLLFILAVASIAASTIILVLDSDPRSGWPAELFAMIVLIAFIPRSNWALTRSIRICAATLYLLMIIFFANVIRWQHKFMIQNNEILSLLEKSENGTIFYDIINPRSTRFSTLFLITREQWVESFHYNCLSQDVTLKKEYAVVPAALKNFKPEFAEPIAGSAGLWNYKGFLVGKDGDYGPKDEDWYSDCGSYDFTTADGRRYHNQICLKLRFRLPDGKAYMYVYPYIPVDGTIIEAIKKEK